MNPQDGISPTPPLTQQETLRYSRHVRLPEVGEEGQRKLKAASVLIVGTGGLGSPAALYLAAAGVGHIGLADPDVVEVSNLQRQIVHGTSRLGEAKVVSARQRLLELNPHIRVSAYEERLTAENAFRIAEPYDLILDGTDNFSSRYLINDLCVLTAKPYVYGSIHGFEGQASVFSIPGGPCYRCIFPEAPVSSSPRAETGVLGVLPGVIGVIQATEAIKLILGLGNTLQGRLLLYDALEMRFDFITLRRNPHCKVCGENPVITSLQDYEAPNPETGGAE